MVRRVGCTVCAGETKCVCVGGDTLQQCNYIRSTYVRTYVADCLCVSSQNTSNLQLLSFTSSLWRCVCPYIVGVKYSLPPSLPPSLPYPSVLPRDRFKREAALSVTQAVTTKRAYQHLAWAKGKDLRGRIRRLKEEEELIKAFKVLEPYSDFGGCMRAEGDRKESVG